MAYYHPCKGCAVEVESCSKRAEIRDAIAGLSVTSIKFKCTERTPFFSAGQRVSFPWGVCVGQDDYGEGVWKKHEFNGTIVCEANRPNRFTVRVDPEGEGYTRDPRDTFRDGRDVVNVKTSTIAVLDESRRDICPSCLSYEWESDRCQAHIGNRFETYIPEGCAKHTIGEAK